MLKVEDVVEVPVLSGLRRAVFAKHGSEYGKPARSNVREREGTTTLTCERGLIPRLPRKVSAERFDPYARYRTVSSEVGFSDPRSMSTSDVVFKAA